MNGLVNFLHDKGIFLAQISKLTRVHELTQSWKNDTDLDIPRELQLEWKSYTTGLNSCDFKLIGEEDTLLWSWNGMNGDITTKLDYDALFYKMRDVHKKWRYKALWKWNLPLKVKLYYWMMFENKILTWDNFLKRSGNGPNMCTLFHMAIETVDHLMAYCQFTKSVWVEIKKELISHKFGTTNPYILAFNNGVRWNSLGKFYLVMCVGRCASR